MATPYIGVYAASYPEYVLSGAVTPAPTITSFSPTSGVAGSTLVITGTNFTGATLVSVNSGAVASFTVNSATQITAVLTSAQSSGLVRVTTAGGTAVSSGSFTVTAGGGSTTPVTPTDAQFWHNVYSGTFFNLPHRSPLAELHATVTGSTMQLSVNTGIHNYHPGEGVALFVDGVFKQVFKSSNVWQEETFTYSFGSAGSHSIVLVEGAQEGGPSETEAIYGAYVTKLTPEAGGSITILNRPVFADRLVINGDSIEAGITDSPAAVYAHVRLLRAMVPGLEVAVDGWGNRQLMKSSDTDALRADAVSRYNAYFAGATNKWYWQEAGINDWGNATGPVSDFTASLLRLLTNVKTVSGITKLFEQTPTYHVNGDASTPAVNAGGYTLPQMRTAITSAVNGLANVQVVPGENILTSADVRDGVHENAQGAQKKAALMRDTLYPTGGSPIQATVPNVAISASRVLTYSHPQYSANQLEISHDNGATYAAYAPVQFDASQHQAGEYLGRVKAASGRLASSTVPSPALSQAIDTSIMAPVPLDGATQFARWDGDDVSVFEASEWSLTASIIYSNAHSGAASGTPILFRQDNWSFLVFPQYNILQFKYQAGAGQSLFQINGSFNNNAATFIALTQRNGSLFVDINGARTQLNINAFNPTGFVLGIGGANDVNGAFSLANIGLWRKGLSDAQLTTLEQSLGEPATSGAGSFQDPATFAAFMHGGTVTNGKIPNLTDPATPFTFSGY